MLDHVRRCAGVSGRGRLLDLACGTGELALTLHTHFREVWAVDQEREMLAVGQAKAARQDAGNVRWIASRAEDLDAEPGSCELITIGNAFHRLDRQLITQRALTWLPPGRCVAVISGTGLWSGTAGWQAVARDVIRQYRANPAAPAGHQAPGQAMRTHQAVLREAGFETEEQDFPARHIWSLGDFIGYLRSTSVYTQIRRRMDPAALEAELRERLLSYDPGGRYEETIDFSCILARKPRHP